MSSMDFYGVIGGSVVVLLNLLELHNVPKEDRPDFRDWLYWLPFILWPFFGGLLVHLYVASDFQLKPLTAFNIGLSAPLTLRVMVGVIPSGQTVDEPDKDA